MADLGTRSTRPFEDGANPCPCPEAVVALLDLAVRYAEASLPTEARVGAQYVKCFMEQPAQTWCRYIEEASV